jgi:hypothetical protein
MKAEGAVAPLASLCRDHEVVGVGAQGFGDQSLAHIGAVGVRCVDEVDAELDSASEDGLGRLRVRRFTPDAVARNPHRPVADPPNGQIASEPDRVDGQARIL